MADPGISDEYSSWRSGLGLLQVFSFGVKFGGWSAFRVMFLSLEIGLASGWSMLWGSKFHWQSSLHMALLI